MTDLVDRLKANHTPNSLAYEAAIEIERLRELPCKFDCRKQKEAFEAGRETHNPDVRILRWRWKNYEEWKKQ